jgi:hypothetical protein
LLKFHPIDICKIFMVFNIRGSLKEKQKK